jgi:WD40 repeat protein
MSGHTALVRCVSGGFVDGCGRQLVASGSPDKSVRLWDVARGTCVRVLTDHDAPVRCVSSAAFVDGQGRTLIASGGEDKAVRLWDVDSGSCVGVLEGHTSWVRSVSEVFSVDTENDGRATRCIASSSDDGTVRLWDVDNLTLVSVLVPNAQRQPVLCVAVGSADYAGRLVVAASSGRTVSLWHVAAGQGKHIGSLVGHTDLVRCVSRVFVDGLRRCCIASTSDDKTMRVWDVATLQCLAVVSVGEELGLSCQRPARAVSVVEERLLQNNTCSLAVGVGQHVVFLEQVLSQC